MEASQQERVQQSVALDINASGSGTLIAGPSGCSAGEVWGTVTLKIFGEVVGPSAYNVEDYQLCVARVNEDSYVLSPARCCKDGARGDEVISSGARTAIQ